MSQRTHKSTEEIEGMISRLQGGVKEAVLAMTSSHDATEKKVQKYGDVTEARDGSDSDSSESGEMSHQKDQAPEEQKDVDRDVDSHVAGRGAGGTGGGAKGK